MLLVVWGVGESIDVCGQAGRGGSFYTCDMMIDANLVDIIRWFSNTSQLLLHACFGAPFIGCLIR